MHDSRLEDQIRSVLRTEGDGVPVTITTAELERRLALRRRDRNGRRLALMAAAIAAIAVGSIVAIGNGWLRMPAVGTDVSPSPAPTASGAVPGDLQPIEGKPGRQEIHRIDPRDSAGLQMVAFDEDAEGDWVVGRVACTGGNDLTLSINGRSVNDLCGDPATATTEHWFAVVDGKVRGSVQVGGEPRFAVLIEQSAPGETPPVGAVPTASPAPTATPAPTPRTTPELGGAHGAVLVRDVVADGRPTLDVTVGTSETDNLVVGQFPIPDGVSLQVDRARVGPTGYLAVPIDELETEPASLLVWDLATPGSDPTRIDGASSGYGWAPNGGLTILAPLAVSVVDPADGRVISATPVPAGIVIADARGGALWAADGSGLLASRVGVASTETGFLGLDGTFVPDSTPELFAPSGMERITDVDGRTLGTGCDSSAQGAPAGGCSVIVSMPGVDEGEPWYTGTDLRDQAWAADGREAWLLLDDAETDATVGDLRLQRGTAGAFEPVMTLSGVSRDATTPQFVGFAGDDGRIAISVGTARTALVDPSTGTWYALDGTFAGWADQTGAAYPVS